MLLLYSFLLVLALPIIIPWFLLQIILKRKYFRNFSQRLGVIPRKLRNIKQDSGLIVLHASSVGEVMLARQVVRALRLRDPSTPIVLTTMTDAGYEIAVRTLPELRGVLFVPLDYRSCVRRFLNSLRPSLLLLLETELWPNLICETRSRGIKVALLNGRISKRSYPRYRMFSFFFRRILARIDLFAMQTRDDADRIRLIGADPARIRVTGNIKFDIPPYDMNHSFAAMIRECAGWFGGEPILVAGSTHAGEEEILMDVFESTRRTCPSLRMIIAPRHLDRIHELRALFDQRRVNYIEVTGELAQGRSAGVADIVLLNVMGHLLDAYHMGKMAFVGGSLVPIGGHNVLEPASLSCPIISGPNVANFSEAVDLLIASRAIRIVRSAEQFAETIMELIRNDDLAEELGERARQVVQQNQGASMRTVDAVIEAVREEGAVADTTLPDVIPDSMGLLRPLAPLAAHLYERVIRIRNGLYDLHWMPIRYAPLPVISIGNLTAGGAGKTPMTMLLAELFSGIGLKPAIVSRGYKGSAGSSPIRVPTDGSWREFGDEPVLMARKLANVPVIVSRKRWPGAVMAQKAFDADLVILDDGFQHRALARDADILLIDARRPPQHDRMLPMGYLRDPLDRVKQAHIVVLTHSDETDHVEEIEDWLAKMTPVTPVFRARHTCAGLFDTRIDAMRDPESLRSIPVAVLCGIANPSGLISQLKNLGSRIVDQAVFKDHHAYNRDEINRAIRQAMALGAQAIVTTAKDDIRLMHTLGNYDIPILVLEIRLEMDRQAEFFQVVRKRIGIS